MDVSLRTPHGDADVELTQLTSTTTLRDLIGGVTGQAVPRVVGVDGRAVDTAVTLADGLLLWGSVVDSNPSALEPGPLGVATLVQIAGPGAGRMHRLVPGRHRIGPGRRSTADELAPAPVVDVVFELVVDAAGAVSIATTGRDEITLDGSVVHSTTSWSDGQVVVVARRAFTVDHRPPAGRRLGPGSPSGTVVFSRPPRRPPTRRVPAVDAVRDACGALPSLWERRLDDPDALSLCAGIAVDSSTPEPVNVDVAAHRTVSITGPDHAALTRTLLVEAVTTHGPADADVVIATTPDRLAEWEWAKWLPHLRVAGRPSILSDPDSIADWARRIAETPPPGAPAWSSDHLTILIADDPELWQRRSAPLHLVVAAPPSHLRVLTSCESTRQAPSSTSLLLEQLPDGAWELESPGSRSTGERFLAALMDHGVATDVARALSPLADHELPPPPRSDPPPRRSLREFVDGDRQLAELLIASRGARICGPPHETTRTATAIALQLCAVRPAASCWLLDLTGSPWTTALRSLPHASHHDLDPSDVDAERLLARLRHHLDRTDRPDLVIVLLDLAEVVGARLVRELARLDGVVALAADAGTTTTDPPELPAIEVGRVDGRRRARVDGLHAVVELDDDEATEGLLLQPAVYGRSLTALERRVARRAAARPEEFATACQPVVTEIAGEMGDSAGSPTLAVASLPAPVDAVSLLDGNPGDAIPLGLVDDPPGDHRTLWWEPSDGHLLAVGPSASAVDDLVTVVLIGLAERFGDADGAFGLVDGVAERRTVVAGTSRCAYALDRDDDTLDGTVAALLDRLEGADDTSPPVLVIDDLGGLRRHAEARGVGERLDEALAASAHPTVVAVGRSLGDLGPLATREGSTVLVAGPDRCHELSTGAPVQLATFTDDPLAVLGSRLGPIDGANP